MGDTIFITEDFDKMVRLRRKKCLYSLRTDILTIDFKIKQQKKYNKIHLKHGSGYHLDMKSRNTRILQWIYCFFKNNGKVPFSKLEDKNSRFVREQINMMLQIHSLLSVTKNLKDLDAYNMRYIKEITILFCKFSQVEIVKQLAIQEDEETWRLNSNCRYRYLTHPKGRDIRMNMVSDFIDWVKAG